MYVVSVVRCLWCINLIINVLKTFEELGVSAEIRQAIEEMGYENPMPVQEEVIPYLLGVNNDVVALAQTGTGKTAAYGLPVLQKGCHAQCDAGSHPESHPRTLFADSG